MKPAPRQSAFTLIELLMVIAIIGILGAITLPSLKNFRAHDALAASTRQLLDDVARARQYAISQRTTVYMVFCPSNFWSNVAWPNATPYGAILADTVEANKLEKLFGKQLTTFRQLLNHTSGLPAWKPYFEEIMQQEKGGRINFMASRAAKNWVYQEIHREKPIAAPGSQALYSDLGYILLGEVVEALTGNTLDRFCHDRIFKPLQLRATGFVDLTQLRTHRIQPVESLIAPTEDCPWRKKILCGEVHDDNAYAMGGVAGHAGLFASARDVHAFLLRMNRCLYGNDDFLPRDLLQEFFKPRESPGRGFALGWDTPSAERSASGRLFSTRSIGHLGYTGCSFWWDLEKNCHVILLTNRVHPTRKNEKIKEFRPLIHDQIMQVLFP